MPPATPALTDAERVNSAALGKADAIDEPEVGAAVATGVAIAAAAGFGALLVRSRRGQLG